MGHERLCASREYVSGFPMVAANDNDRLSALLKKDLRNSKRLSKMRECVRGALVHMSELLPELQDDSLRNSFGSGFLDFVEAQYGSDTVDYARWRHHIFDLRRELERVRALECTNAAELSILAVGLDVKLTEVLKAIFEPVYQEYQDSIASSDESVSTWIEELKQLYQASIHYMYPAQVVLSSETYSLLVDLKERAGESSKLLSGGLRSQVLMGGERAEDPLQGTIEKLLNDLPAIRAGAETVHAALESTKVPGVVERIVLQRFNQLHALKVQKVRELAHQTDGIPSLSVLPKERLKELTSLKKLLSHDGTHLTSTNISESSLRQYLELLDAFVVVLASAHPVFVLTEALRKLKKDTYEQQ